MSPVLFLAVAVVASVLGTLLLWAKSREPNTPDASIAQFNAKLRALSGDGQPPVADEPGERQGS